MDYLNTKEGKGTLMVSLSGILYGLIGYFGTNILHDGFSVSEMLFWRFLIAAIWILLTNLIFSKNIFNLAETKNQKLLLKISLLAIFTYSASSGFYFIASQSIGTGTAMTIFFSYPIMIAVFAMVFDHWKLNGPAILSLLAVIIGLCLLRDHDQPLALNGMVFGFTAAFFYAVYVFSNHISAKIMKAELQTFLVSIGNIIIFLILALTQTHFLWPNSLSLWINIIAIGILGTALPLQLLLNGLKYITPFKASILSVLEPVVTVLLGLILLHEHLTPVQIIGVMIVLLGAIFVQFERSQEPLTIKE